MTTAQPPSPTEERVRELVMGLAATHGYDGAALGREQALAAIGFDSLMTIELIAILEDELGIDVPDERLTPASFNTIGSVVALVDSLQ